MVTRFTLPTLLLSSVLSATVARESSQVPIAFDGSTGAPVNNKNNATPHWDWQELMDEDYDWEELSDEQRAFFSSRRWTERTWDCRVEEETLFAWDELSPERKLAWQVRGWDQERWDDSVDECQVAMQISTPDKFNPIVIDIDVPQLQEITMESLKDLDTEIRLVEGDAVYGNEQFADNMALRDFIAKAQGGDKQLYLHLEEGMNEKNGILQKLVGDRIEDHLLHAVSHHPTLRAEGIWKEQYEVLDEDSFDWAMFIGGKGTISSLHYDSDVLNFLYVAEGRKRLVMIPNDERTVGTFKTGTNEDGGTGWGELDVLNRSVPLPEFAVEVEIGPGQGIAIPYVAWHAVENLETSLAFSLRIVD